MYLFTSIIKYESIPTKTFKQHVNLNYFNIKLQIKFNNKCVIENFEYSQMKINITFNVKMWLNNLNEILAK